MRLKHQWWSRLVAAMLGGLVGVTTGAAAGEQFLPMLTIREGVQRFAGIPVADGYIAYLTLLNERDGGINGVTLVWEECETVMDVPRGIECYERLKAKGSTGAAVCAMSHTPLTYALTERATHDQIPLLASGLGRSDAADGRVFPYVFNAPSNWWSQNTARSGSSASGWAAWSSSRAGTSPMSTTPQAPARKSFLCWTARPPGTALPSSTWRCNRQGSIRRRPGCGSRSPSPTGSSCTALAAGE